MAKLKQAITKDAPPMAEKPWYRRGGMHINNVGLTVNTVLAVFVLACTLPENERNAFICLLGASIATCVFDGTCKTEYCTVVVPMYLCSLFLVGSLNIQPALMLTMSFMAAGTKINICMSVCLHRYAAHSAFKCGPVTSVFINTLGCLANQGGPLWWGSQHRCHHKYCDLPRDPHSPIQVGAEEAFVFMVKQVKIEEEFVPNHLESFFVRVLDTWAWAVVSLELIAAYAMFGREGLFLAYTSGWICQATTLWFNIANHPPDKASTEQQPEKKVAAVCKASNTHAVWQEQQRYLPFLFLDMLSKVFFTFIDEGEHESHHSHAGLAKRSKADSAYWSFIRPLEELGLVWNVNVK
jgi:stearoyl-CoA desaturase (delta-9 desaturase)